MWLTRRAHLKLYFSAIIIQSHVRGFVTRQRFLHVKEHKAATFVQVIFQDVLYVVGLLDGQNHDLCLHHFYKIDFIGYHPSLRILPLSLSIRHCLKIPCPIL